MVGIMEKVKLLKYNKLHVAVILTFTMLMLILGVSGMSFYYNSIKYTKEEMKQTNLMRLGYVRDMIDNEISASIVLSSKLCVDPYIKKISTMKDESEISELQIRKALDNFALYSKASGTSGEFYIWFRNIDLCLSSTSKYNKDIFKDIFCRQKKFFSNENIEFFETANLSRKLLFERDGGKSKGKLMNVFVVSPNGYGIPTTVIIIPLNANVFYMDDDIMKNTYIMVEDDENSIIVNTAEYDTELVVDGDENDLKTYGKGKDKIVYSYMKSKVMDWKYIVAMNYSQYRTALKSQTAIFILILLIELICAFVICLLFWNKNYTPIKEILSIIPYKNNDENELKLIKYNILQMKYISDANMDIIERQQNMIKYFFISDLILNNERNFDNFDSEIKKYGISFLSNRFCVFIVYVFDDGALKKDTSYSSNDDSVDELIESSVKNVVEELSNKKNLGYVVSSSGILCCLLNFGEEKKDDLSTVTDISQKTMEFFEKYYDFQMKISIGKIVYGVENISESFRSALSYLEHHIYDDDKKVIKYKEEDAKQSTMHGIKNSIVLSIQDGNAENTIEFFEMAISEIKEKSISKSMYQKHLNELFIFITEYIQTLNKKSDGAFIDETNILLNIVLFDTEESKVIDEIERILRKVCNYQASLNTDHKNLVYQKIIKYIEENYVDKNFTSQLVADEFNLSVKYFLRFFKENAGCGFLEYLHRLRIEKAKEILKENSTEIKKIYIDCGYTSYTTFVRAFKKITGMSPQKYRDSM